MSNHSSSRMISIHMVLVANTQFCGMPLPKRITKNNTKDGAGVFLDTNASNECYAA